MPSDNSSPFDTPPSSNDAMPADGAKQPKVYFPNSSLPVPGQDILEQEILEQDLIEQELLKQERSVREVYYYRPARKTYVISLLLFFATCLSTFAVGANLWAGAFHPDGLVGFLNEAGWWNVIQNGLWYSVPVMLILLAHEMGHFLQAVRYGVPATPPFFIPMPLPPLGTFGAVIIQQAGVSNRKSNFDIAISGPLAGLVLALPVAWYAIAHSTLVPIPPGGGSLRFGEPLIMQWMIYATHGVLPEGMDVNIGSLGLAGWVGIFITALNLIPIGQLDGGHILYALLGKRAHFVARFLVTFAVVYMVLTQNFAYALMLGLIMYMGVSHPPTADDTVPLGRTRIVLGWLTLAFIIIGFTPQPLIMS